MIREMKDQGLSISEISRKLGISGTTVRKYPRSGKIPQYHRNPPGSQMDRSPLFSGYDQRRKSFCGAGT
jgi:transposase